MSWWSDQVVPRVADALLRSEQVGRLRERACAGLAGEVLEIGFGSGLNARHYPPQVRRVLAVEPSDVAWEMAQKHLSEHLGAGAPEVVRAGLDGQVLQLADASCDHALSTFTLCTIPDLEAALREVHRVLRPGGSFHFLEHGLAPDPGVARWQHRLTPVQRRLGAGCHLDRPIADAVEEAGLVVQEIDRFYLAEKVPGAKVVGHLYLGRAAVP